MLSSARHDRLRCAVAVMLLTSACSRAPAEARLAPQPRASIDSSSGPGSLGRSLSKSLPSESEPQHSADENHQVQKTAAPATLEKPEEGTAREVLRALGIGEDGWKVVVSDWRARPGSSVALVFRSVAPNEAPANLKPLVAILLQDEAHLRVVAKGALDMDDNPCLRNTSSSPSRAPELTLDLAPYKLSATETAVGVRLSCEFFAPGAEGDVVNLYLFRQQHDALEVVFNQPVSLSFYDRVAQEQIESGSTVSMGTIGPRGLADILVRSTDVHRHGETKPGRKTVKTVRFTYVSPTYVSR